jgi:mannonate dehydratase
MKNGYLWVSEQPGWGIEIDEKAAAKMPFAHGQDNLNGGWGEIRRSSNDP